MRRVLLVIVPILFIVTIFVGYKLTNRDRTLNIGSFQIIARNVRTPYLNNNQLHYSTGSNLAALDLSTGNITRTSGFLLLPTMDSTFSVSKNSALFFASTYPTFSSLQTAQNSTSLKNQGIWWRYDFTQNQMALLKTISQNDGRALHELNNSLYWQEPYRGSDYLTVLYKSGLDLSQKQKVADLTDSVQLSIYKEGIAYGIGKNIDDDNVIYKVNLSSGEVRKIYSTKETITNFDISQDSKTLLISYGKKLKSSELGDHADINQKQSFFVELFDINTSRQIMKKNLEATNVNIGFESNQAWLSTEYGLYIQNESKFLKVSGDSLINIRFLTKVNNYYAMVNEDGLLYSNSPQLLQSKKRSGYDYGDEDTTNKGFMISKYSSGKSQIYVYNRTISFEKNAANIELFLRTKGYDMNQFNFEWQLEGNKGVVPVENNILIL